MADTDNEAELRLRRQSGGTPGPEAAHQEDRTRRQPLRGTSEEGHRMSRDIEGTAPTRPEKQADDGAAEPAPAEADRLSEPEGRPLDRREREP